MRPIARYIYAYVMDIPFQRMEAVDESSNRQQSGRGEPPTDREGLGERRAGQEGGDQISREEGEEPTEQELKDRLEADISQQTKVHVWTVIG